MTPDLLAMLTPVEARAWALCESCGPYANMGDDGTFAGEVRRCSDFALVHQDCDDSDARKFIAEASVALPLALTTIATLRAELRAVADLIQEVGVLGIASTMDAVVVSGQPSARDLLTWAAKAMDAWPKERQALRAELNGILDDARVLAAAVGVPADSDAPMTEALRRVEAQRDALAMAEEREREMVTARDILRETLAEQQRAFAIGLDLAQRTADAEIAELRATLDNERGEGVGPSKKWTWLDGAWRILDDLGECTMSVHLFDHGRWHWRQHDPPYGRSKFPFASARSAMKAADDAVKESP